MHAEGCCHLARCARWQNRPPSKMQDARQSGMASIIKADLTPRCVQGRRLPLYWSICCSDCGRRGAAGPLASCASSAYGPQGRSGTPPRPSPPKPRFPSKPAAEGGPPEEPPPLPPPRLEPGGGALARGCHEEPKIRSCEVTAPESSCRRCASSSGGGACRGGCGGSRERFPPSVVEVDSFMLVSAAHFIASFLRSAGKGSTKDISDGACCLC
mmetsp:Transcript_44787/g.119878  ORF Transcript_44787/g.119878 Transcript_44787/m.119878 type:complete len:213 (-) Transcript_44787:1729-2367(-)